MRNTTWRIAMGACLLVGLLAAGMPAPAAAAPAVTFAPAALDFGDQQVGTRGTVNAKVTNSGDTPLVFSFVNDVDTSPDRNQLTFDLYGDTNNECPFTFRQNPVPLAPGQSCILGLGFQPRKPGRLQATVSLGLPGAPPIGNLPVTGNAVTLPGKPALGWDNGGVGFSLRGIGMSSGVRRITLTNYGDAPLDILGMSFLPQSEYNDARDFSYTETCGAAIAPKSSCNVDFVFKPQGPTRPPRVFQGIERDYRNVTLRIINSAAGTPHFFGAFGEATALANCFPAATDLCIDPYFLARWRDHGGLAINGFPISDLRFERLEDGRFYEVQYFERVRMEWHPEATDPQYRVQLGQFGRRIHPADPPVPAIPGATYFEATGHNVTRPEFVAFWLANGGLAQFGFPLSEEFEETLEDGKRYRVQYFERARFEWHPEAPEPFKVQLGQFGRRVCGGGCR
jgi:hypothetical protein